MSPAGTRGARGSGRSMSGPGSHGDTKFIAAGLSLRLELLASGAPLRCLHARREGVCASCAHLPFQPEVWKLTRVGLTANSTDELDLFIVNVTRCP